MLLYVTKPNGNLNGYYVDNKENNSSNKNNNITSTRLKTDYVLTITNLHPKTEYVLTITNLHPPISNAHTHERTYTKFLISSTQSPIFLGVDLMLCQTSPGLIQLKVK